MSTIRSKLRQWLTLPGSDPAVKHLLEPLEARIAPATILVSGNIPSGTTWSEGNVYRVTADATVPAGATLTIQPGAIIQFNPFAGIDLTCEGNVVQSAGSAKILFTSVRDDTGLNGIAGGGDDIDTEGNGATIGGSGDWGQIRFASTSTAALNNIDVRFGGANVAAEVVIESGNVSLTNSVIRNSATVGVRIASSNPTLTGVNYLNNSGSAVSMDLLSNPTISGVTVTNNGINGLTLDAGMLSGSRSWNDPDIVYRISGDITVAAGATLTIAPGQTVKVRPFAGDDLIVNGTLNADGTATAPIIFTSDRDDSVGGDTNNNGATTGGNGDWESITFGMGSTGNVMDNVQVRFAGANTAAAVVLSPNTGLSLTNSIIRNSNNNGLRIIDSNPTLTTNTFQDNRLNAISMDLLSNPAISGVTATNNGINGLTLDGGTLNGSRFWDDPDIVYRIAGDITVAVGATLTIASGQIVKVRPFAGDDLFVNGRLLADGTAAAPIIFTSDRDDTVGGDTNNNGPTTGANGDWESITFGSGSTGNVMDNVQVRFAGANTAAAVVLGANTGLSLTNSVIRNSNNNALRIIESNPTLTANTFQESRLSAISMDLVSNPVITGVTVTNNGINGLTLDAGILSGSRSWNDPDIVYRISGDITVAAGATLTIAPGQIVKVRPFAGDDFIVNGTLNADGTPTAPIIFTSERDDSVGGDTNNNGATTGGNGDWESITFGTGSTGNVIDNVQVRFAGANTAAAVVLSANTGLSLTNSVIRNSNNNGLRIIGSNPTLTANSFQDNRLSAISMDLASNPAISGVTLVNNGTNGLTVESGTLTGSRVWDDADIVYRISEDLTVDAGATLTIAAGQIVKVRPFGGVDLIVNGTLRANGTVARPIIFTSDRDDTVAGDTNNNPTTFGSNGDWNSIQFGASSTGSILESIEVRFAGANSAAAIVITDSDAIIRNSTIRQSTTDGVAVRSGGTLTANNNIIRDNTGTGIWADSGGVVTAFNNTIDGNNRGVVAEGAASSLILTNNLITNHSRSGVFTATGGAVTANTNDVFNPIASSGNYEGLANLTATNGNISIDPKYFNRAGKQFQLRGGSAVIDAGSSTGAPATDLFGNPRFDDPYVLNTGTGPQLFVDMGAIERREVSTSDVDLRTVTVTGLTTGLQAQNVTVNWTIQNLGPAAVVGSWFDAVYLSTDEIFTPDDIFLGDAQHSGANGDLAPGASYSATRQVTLPGVLPDDYFFIVRANSRNEIFEGASLINNSRASSAPIAMDLPVLNVGTSVTGQIAQTGGALFYKINAPAGADLAVTLDGPNGASNELYLKFGDLPSRQAFDERGNRAGSPDQNISVSDTQGGQYYVQVFGSNLPAAETFTISASLAGFGITGISPVRGSNTGEVTVTITGSQFDVNSQPHLIDSANQTLAPTRVVYTDSGQISATFNLAGRPLGPADIQVVNTGTVTTTLPDSLNIIAGSPGRLVTNLVAPSQVRLGRNFQLVVEYSNVGDTDLLAPVMHLEGSGFSTLSFSPDLSESATALDIIGINQNGPAGTLPPGAKGRLTFYGQGTGNGDESFRLLVAQYPGQTINWTPISPLIKPANVSDAEWNPTFAELQSNIGDTWDDFARVVAADATLLPAVRGFSHSLRDVVQLEIDRAFADVEAGVSGRVFLRDAVHPLGNVEVVLFNTVTDEVFVGFSLNDGTFFVPSVTPGSYQVSIDGFIPVGAAPIVMGTADLNGVQLITTPAGTISGGVFLDPQGVPARNLVVTATMETGDTFSALTDDNGRYTIDSLPAGSYTIRSGGGAFAFDQTTATLEAGQARANVNLGVEISSTVRGRITGPAGPVAGAIVVAVGADGESLAGTTSATGDFEISNLKGQLYTVRATQSGLVTTETNAVNVPAGGTVLGVNLTLVRAGTLQGTLTGTGGVVLEGVLVSAVLGEKTFSTQTDAQGRYFLDQLPPGIYALTAGADEVMTTSATVSVTAGATGTQNLSAPARGTVSGKVTAVGSGAGVSGVTVFITEGDELVATTVTNATGDYTLPALNAGSYQVAVGDAGSGVVRSNVSITPAQATASANFSLGVAGTVAGTLRTNAGGATIAGGSVSLLLDGDIIATTNSDSTGNYSFVVLAAGNYTVEATADGRFFTSITGLAVSGGANLTGRDLTAGGRAIAGTITDQATGLPLANATVVITRTDIGDETSSKSVTAAANGTFTFPGAVPGTFNITAYSSGHAFATQTATVTAGNGANVALALPAEVVLRGTVRGLETSGPLEGAIVKLSGPIGSVETVVVTDASGAFEFHNLAAGTYDVTVVQKGRETIVLRNVAINAQTQPFNVSLNTGTIRVAGVVRNASGPISDASVIAFDAGGAILAQATTANDGTYTLDSLPPGAIIVAAGAANHVAGSSIARTVVRGENVTLGDFVLVPGAIADPRPTPELAIALAAAADSELYKPLFTKPARLADDPITGAFPQGVCEPVKMAFANSAEAKAVTEAYRAWEAAYEEAEIFRIGASVVPRLIKNSIAELEKTFSSLSSLLEGVKGAAVIQSFLAVMTADLRKIKDGVNSLSTLTDLGKSLEAADNAARIVQTLEFISFATLFVKTKTSNNPLDALKGGVINIALGRLDSIEKMANTLRNQVNGLAGTALVSFDLFKADHAYQSAVENALNKVQHDSFMSCGCMIPMLPVVAEIDTAEMDCGCDFEPFVTIHAELPILECPVPPMVLEPLGGADDTPPTAADAPGSQSGGTAKTAIRSSFDPNDKHGPSGFGAGGFIQPGVMPYEVEFENIGQIAAQIVEVTDTLDADLDLSTFEFTGFGFSNRVFTVPEGLTHFETTLDLRPEGIQLLVPLVLDLNPTSRLVKVTFSTLDPLTMQAPEGFEGFLPPNNPDKLVGTADDHQGEGFFTYTVSPKAGLTSGTVITNQANIVFDTNAPILTPTTTNTFDLDSPASAVAALPASSNTAFSVSWAGTDAASGVASYDVFVSDNGAAPTFFLDDTTQTSATFTGLVGHTYSFFTVARDNVGLVEAPPSAPDATTAVTGGTGDVTPPTSVVTVLPSTSNSTFTVNWSGSDGVGGSGIANYTLFVSDNGGPFTAFLSNTTLTSTSFTGQQGHTYGFYTVARDNAGLIEAPPSIADATTTITSNLPTLSVAATDALSAEVKAGGASDGGTFTFTRTGNLAAPLTVPYTVAGTASSGTDYTALSGNLEFAAGSATATVELAPLDDRLKEGSETVVLTLQPVQGFAIVNETAGVAILDDDVPTISVTASDSTAAETAKKTKKDISKLTFTREGSAKGKLIVEYTVDGTAAGGDDYKQLSGKVVFKNGSKKAVVKITPVDDTSSEGSETVRVNIASSSKYNIGATSSATVTIADNDAEALGTGDVLDGIAAIVGKSGRNIERGSSSFRPSIDLAGIQTLSAILGKARR